MVEWSGCCHPHDLIRCHLRKRRLNGLVPRLLERAKQEYLLYVRYYHTLATRLFVEK